MANLHNICTSAELLGIDCVGFARNNWWDLARNRRREDWWPDYQWRLLARHVKYKWRVHPALANVKVFCKVPPEVMTIQHFNLAYRTDADWQETNAFYDRLMALDVKEGRIP